MDSDFRYQFSPICRPQKIGSKPQTNSIRACFGFLTQTQANNNLIDKAMSDETLNMLRYAISLMESTTKTVDQLLQRMDTLEQQLQKQQFENSGLITTQQAAELLQRNRKTLEVYRRKYWIEGIHYFPQDKDIFYNRELLQDWQKNRHNAEAHQRAIKHWQSQQLSNQRLKPGRRKAS